MAKVDRNRVGELRPTQMLYGFGIGAIVDLPNISVMLMGLDDWDAARVREIEEERLLAAVQSMVGGQVERLVGPPMPAEVGMGVLTGKDEDSRIGVPVATFPRWLRCPACGLLAPIKSELFRFKYDPYRMDRARWVHWACPRSHVPPTVVPARFLVACKHGHLDDFPWVHFVHRGADCPNGNSVLEMREMGASGEAADILVKCRSCEAQRIMAQAIGEEGARSLPRCRGRRPHLRDYAESKCGLDVKTTNLGASDLWFPVTRNALSIPVGGDDLATLVDDHWGALKDVDELAIVKFMRKRGELTAFAKVSDDDLLAAIEARRAGAVPEDDATDLKAPEWEVLTAPGSAPKGADFVLEQVDVPEGFEDVLAQVVLAERLREVTALVGFTRLESVNDLGGEAGQRPMGLSRKPPRLVPAGEVRGEGIFLQFREDSIATWADALDERREAFLEAHRSWRLQRGLQPPEGQFPELRFVLIHTFAHALMRQLALECGYSAASIRERIYAREPGEAGGPMAGLLLYTAAPDSEGTLGGLVHLGQPEQLGRHIRQALEAMTLCASDPLCAEHLPEEDGRTLHGAACHACLFSPETSCERGNRYLDRSVLVPTVEGSVTPFFEKWT